MECCRQTLLCNVVVDVDGIRPWRHERRLNFSGVVQQDRTVRCHACDRYSRSSTRPVVTGIELLALDRPRAVRSPPDATTPSRQQPLAPARRAYHTTNTQVLLDTSVRLSMCSRGHRHPPLTRALGARCQHTTQSLAFTFTLSAACVRALRGASRVHDSLDSIAGTGTMRLYL